MVISNISELPPDLLALCRRLGWTDEEIIENLEDAADLLNTIYYCDDSRKYMSLRDFLSQKQGN